MTLYIWPKYSVSDVILSWRALFLSADEDSNWKICKSQRSWLHLSIFYKLSVLEFKSMLWFHIMDVWKPNQKTCSCVVLLLCKHINEKCWLHVDSQNHRFQFFEEIFLQKFFISWNFPEHFQLLFSFTFASFLFHFDILLMQFVIFICKKCSNGLNYLVILYFRIICLLFELEGLQLFFCLCGCVTYVRTFLVTSSDNSIG